MGMLTLHTQQKQEGLSLGLLVSTHQQTVTNRATGPSTVAKLRIDDAPLSLIGGARDI